MISMTWTKAPADLLGLGGFDACATYASVAGDGSPVRLAAPLGGTAPFAGTRLPSGGGVVRLRPLTGQAIRHDVVSTKTFENNGTTLGIHSSRRPQS